ncbi:MAG TPA: PmoA family protein [Armatimonadota bacterium]|nr:PmoA family protein [Armatimonadota bacterium]
MIIRHSIGNFLELQAPAREAPLWRYNYGGKPKPYFHPLHTPAGSCLSLFEPHDHLWHRGLWFAVKFINGENFWEEYGEYGSVVPAAPPGVSHGMDGSIAWEQRLDWQRPNAKGAVFAETRVITFRPLDDESYVLDWDVRLTALADLNLDRTPFTTWGGYGGLILRGSRSWQETRLLFSDGSTSERPTGCRATWCDLSGVFDGGVERKGGLALFDHPRNVRHPSPWYGATGSGHYFNAAFLFHEPMRLSKDESLRLRYRALIHDGIWDVTRLQRAYDAYAAGAPPDDRGSSRFPEETR